MPRDNLLKGRYSQAQQIYHVTICTEKRLNWFNDLHCGRIVVHQMQNLHEQNKLKSMAWVVMPDHLHWLFQLGDSKTLSGVIKQFKATSALEVNAFLQRKGRLWQRGFYDHALRGEENIRQIARYIVANPIRAGLVEKIADYPLWDAM
ncbi:MAG: transposase, partial [Methylomonas sp.]|uniref:REP-associated tyrosine transposase n=1 Tax=Methylomonas sp. TaxID=418 RepID=UPI0025E64B96